MGRAGWTAGTLAQFKETLSVLQRFVGLYALLGGKIVAGTDTPQQFVVPGDSLHRELELCVASGLSPEAALRAATRDAAALLGIQDRVGTIAPGHGRGSRPARCRPARGHPQHAEESRRW